MTTQPDERQQALNLIRTTDTDKVIILIDPATCQVVTAAQDHPGQRQPLLKANPGSHPLTGRIAEALFLALAGRTFHEAPECAEAARAWLARRDLLGLHTLPGYDIALAVLGKAGATIFPNLGLTVLAEEVDRGLVKAEASDQLICRPLGRRLIPAEYQLPLQRSA
jgi:hypothetical protein